MKFAIYHKAEKPFLVRYFHDM